MKNKLKELFIKNHNDKIPMNIRKLNKSSSNYAICMTPRSGSTLLTSILRQTNCLGNPEEWFNPGSIEGWIKKFNAESIVEYIDCIRRHQKTSNDIFGCELPYYQFHMLLELLTIEEIFDDKPSWFYLRRKDLVLQGISLYRSVESGHFHSHQENDVSIKEYKGVEYDGNKIKHWIQHIYEQETGFESLFTKYDFEPIRIYYEDFILDKNKIIKLFFNVMKIRGKVFYNEENEKIKKISDHKNLEWKIKFENEYSDFIADINNSRPALY